MTPEELKKLVKERDKRKVEEMFRDDAGVGKFLAQRDADQNRMGCMGILLVIGVAALTIFYGKSCQGWH